MFKVTREVLTSTSERRSGFDTADDEFETDDDRGLLRAKSSSSRRLGSRSKDFRSTDEDADIDDWQDTDTFARFTGQRSKGATLDGKDKCTCCPYGYHVDLDFLRELNGDEYDNVMRDPRYLVEHHRRLHQMQQQQFRQRASNTSATSASNASAASAGAVSGTLGQQQQQAFQQDQHRQQQQHHQQQQHLQQHEQKHQQFHSLQQQHQQHQQKHFQHQAHQQQHQYHLQQQQQQHHSTLRSKSPHSAVHPPLQEPTYENALALYGKTSGTTHTLSSSTRTSLGRDTQRSTLNGHRSGASYPAGTATVANGYDPETVRRQENVTVGEDGSITTRVIEEVHKTRTTIIDYDSEEEGNDERDSPQKRPKDRAPGKPGPVSSPEPSSPGYEREVAVDPEAKLLPRQQHLVELQKKLQRIQPVDQRGPLRTYVNAADPKPISEEDKEDPEKVHKNRIPSFRPKPDEEEEPARKEPVNRAHRDPDPDWLREKEELLKTIKRLEDDRQQEKRNSNKDQLNWLQEKEDYERKIGDLENENRRNTEDTKRRLALLDRQLKSKEKATRDAGVGDQRVDLDNDETFTTTRHFQVVGSQQPQQPVRIHEKELNTEETTEIREREVKTIFVSGIDDKFSLAVANQPSIQRSGTDVVRRRETKSIGVGDGNVFDDSQSRMEVLEKELRTVYIGGPEGGKVQTRNVGILCKAAMRDVGMVHAAEDERPTLKNASVGVGEIGVSESDVSFTATAGPRTREFVREGDDGAVAVNQHLVAKAAGDEGEESWYASSGFCQTTLTNVKGGGGGLAGLQGDKLKAYLEGVLKRTVHSVGVQCQFSTENKGTDAARVGYDIANVGVSDDTIDVEVRPLTVMKSVAIDNRPSLFHRCIGTEFVFKLDVGTNTRPQETYASRATNTDPKRALPVATMTDPTRLQSVQTGTELPVFFALDQLRSTGIMTDDVDMYNKRVNTETDEETRLRIGTSARSATSAALESSTVQSSEAREIIRGEEQATGYRRYVEETVTPGYLISHTRTSRSRTHRDGSGPRRSGSSADRGDVPYTTSTVIQTRDKSPRRVTFDASVGGSKVVTTGDITKNQLLGVERVSTTRTLENDGVSQVVTETKGPGYKETVVRESYSSSATGGGGGKTVGIPLVPGVAGFPREFFSEDGKSVSATYVSNVSTSGVPLAPERTSRSRTAVGSSSSSSSSSTLTRTETDEKTGTTRYITETKGPGYSETTVRSSYTSVDVPGSFGLEFSADASGSVPGHSVKGPYYTEKTVTTASASNDQQQQGGGGATIDLEFKAGGGSTSLFQSSVEGGHYVTEISRSGGHKAGQVLVNEAIPIKIDESGVSVSGGSGASHVTKQTVEKRSYSTGSTSEGSLTSSLGGGHGIKTVIRESYGPNNVKTVTTEKIDMKTGQVISSSTTQTHYDHLPKFEEAAAAATSSSSASSSMISSSSRATFDFARSAMTSERFVPDSELASACENYALWIKDNSKVTQTQLKEAESVVTNRWLHAAGGEASNVHLVRSFVAYLNELSPELLRRVINSTDENGNTVLHFALSHSRMDVVQVVLDAKMIDVDRANAVGNTPVLISALAVEPTKFNLDVLKSLYSIGNVNAKAFGSGQTALMLATGRGRVEIVELLLSGCCKCDINARDSEGFTALAYAAQKGHTDIVKILLATGKCDVSIKNNDGKTALEVAKHVGHEFIVSQLESHMKGLQKI